VDCIRDCVLHGFTDRCEWAGERLSDVAGERFGFSLFNIFICMLSEKNVRRNRWRGSSLISTDLLVCRGDSIVKFLADCRERMSQHILQRLHGGLCSAHRILNQALSEVRLDAGRCLTADSMSAPSAGMDSATSSVAGESTLCIASVIVANGWVTASRMASRVVLGSTDAFSSLS
jgi:hypothetical protein